jgi:hypothetical protein
VRLAGAHGGDDRQNAVEQREEPEDKHQRQ